ncbi:Transcription initiation protein spt3 [Ceratobasidium sp. 395]|nr:Transcription initiation protein spt3 [Ceratobasidium sp. 395]
MSKVKVPGEEKSTSKEYRYTTEISQMMFVFGEVQDPLTETVNLVEDIVRGQVVEILIQARQLAARKGARNVTSEDLIFLIRYDRGKVNRLRTYLGWKDVRKNAKQDGDGAGAAEVDIDDGQADEATTKPRKMTVKLPWDIITVYSEVLRTGVNAKEDEDEDEDEVEAHEDSIARLREADEATRRMTKDEYVHYSECRSASFTYRKAKRFREFINLPAYLDIKPNDDTIDILGFLAFEMVRALCVGGLTVKRALEESYQAVEISGAKRKAPSSDSGAESPAKRRRSLSPESGGAWGSVPGSSLFLPPPEARRALRPAHIQEAFAKMQRDWAHQRGSGMRNWRGGLTAGHHYRELGLVIYPLLRLLNQKFTLLYGYLTTVLQTPLGPHHKSVVWSPEKEKILWNELSRSWANLYAINWTNLSAQLDVPVPYLLHRAQVKYEEDLRGLQGIRQAPLSAGPPVSVLATSPADERPFGYSGQRTLTARPSIPGSNPLSPSASTPTSAPRLRRLSSSGPTASKLSRVSNGSTHTLVQPATNATRMARLNPVLTPLGTATGSQSSTPGSTPSGTDSEDEREAKEEAQREEADQLAQKLKDLQKMMGSGAFGFARARPKPLESSPAPSITSSQNRSQTATVSIQPKGVKRASTTPTATAAMRADASATPTSASASASVQSSIPDIPSPASSSRARLPVRVTRRATSASTRRSPSAVSEVPDRGPVGKVRAQDAGSGHVSNASSFSDLSDTDMSASALEDALMSNNFRSTTAGSRLSMFSRHPRGPVNARHSRYP